MPTELFPFGKIFISPKALEACQSFPIPPDLLVVRHAIGDWKDMDHEDQVANRIAIIQGARIFTSYEVGVYRFFVITEADRSITTILLAAEYWLTHNPECNALWVIFIVSWSSGAGEAGSNDSQLSPTARA